MESELADERWGRRGGPPPDPSSAWEALWPPRTGSGPEGRPTPARRTAEPSAPPALATTATTGGHDARELEARLERLAAVAGCLSEQVAGLSLAVQDAGARLDTVERELRDVTRSLTASVEELRADLTEGVAARAQVAEEVQAGLHALRSDLLAAAATEKDAAAREAALETRLESRVGDIVTTNLAHLGLDGDARHAVTRRLDAVDAQLQTVTGELARLRRQLTSAEARLDQRLVPLVRRLSETGSITEALMSSTQADAVKVTALGDELRDDLARMSRSMEIHRSETASRADLVALEAELKDRVAGDLASARSQLDARVMTLDAVVDAVDAAAAALETGLVERVTGVATVAATSALAPVRSDLRSVQAEVAATQRSLRELRRQVRTSLPAPAATAGGSTKATPKKGLDTGTTAREPSGSS